MEGKDLWTITGNELTDSEKNMKPDERRKPDGLKHVSNEVWKMIANPPQEQIPKNTIVPEDKYDNVWDAIVNATPNQLANDAELKEGQCFAYPSIGLRFLELGMNPCEKSSYLLTQ